MTGFYSKDFILESAYGQFYFSSIVVYFIASIGATFTTIYSVKVLYLTFLSNPHGPLVSYKNAHEGDLFLSLPLIILAIFSIFFGYVAKDIYVGLGSSFFIDNSLFIHPSHEIMIETEFATPTLFKLLPLISTIIFTIIAILISEFSPLLLMDFKYSRLGYNTFVFFNQRFFVELFYNKYVTGTILTLGGQTTKLLDRGSLELIGPYGLEKGLLYLGKSIASLDTGIITSYALYILVGLTFYITIPYLFMFDHSLFIIVLFALLSLTPFNYDKLNSQRLVNKPLDSHFGNYNNSADLNFPPKPHSFQSQSQESNFLSVMLENEIYSRMFSTINFNLDKLYAVYSEIYTNGYFII